MDYGTGDINQNETSTNGTSTNFLAFKINSLTTTQSVNSANITPTVYFKYDNQDLPSGTPSGFNRGKAVGRLVAVTYGSGTTSVGSYYGYDSLGRVLRRTQQIGSSSNNYAVQGSYELSGAMMGGTHPDDLQL